MSSPTKPDGESPDLAGQVVWVIGAAGDIGRGIGATLASRGATVVGSSRRLIPVDDSPETTDTTPWHRWVAADIRSKDSLANALFEIKNQFGRINAVVISITLPIFGDLLELDADGWLAVLETKLVGSVKAIQTVAPNLIENGGGSIILITGTARGNIPGLKHWPGSATNASLNFLVNGFSARLAPAGIRINAIAPGPIVSERSAIMARLSTAPSTTHLQRSGLPADIGEAVSFLLSAKASFITGTVLPVDGGGRLPQ